MCDVLAAYSDHPNVLGVTVSASAVKKRGLLISTPRYLAQTPNFNKPIIYFQTVTGEGRKMMRRRCY